MGIFFKRSAKKVPAVALPTDLKESLRVHVIADQQGLAFIKLQLELDINGKALGYRPIPYTLFELIGLEALLNRQPETGRSTVIYSHAERQQVAAYIVKYYVAARDVEDVDKAEAYNRLLGTFLEYATLINVEL